MRIACWFVYLSGHALFLISAVCCLFISKYLLTPSWVKGSLFSVYGVWGGLSASSWSQDSAPEGPGACGQQQERPEWMDLSSSHRSGTVGHRGLCVHCVSNWSEWESWCQQLAWDGRTDHLCYTYMGLASKPCPVPPEQVEGWSCWCHLCGCSLHLWPVCGCLPGAHLHPHDGLDLGSGAAAALILLHCLINMIYFPLKKARKTWPILEKLQLLRENSSKVILLTVFWILRNWPQ